MNVAIAIAIGSAIIGLLSFVSTQISMRRTADTTYVSSIEGRLRDSEKHEHDCLARVAELAIQISQLRDENSWLTRQLIKLERDGRLTLDEANPLVMRAQAVAEAAAVKAGSAGSAGG